ncbi:DNA-3-methyladenine glycosylase family protein [Brevibacillus borstelensis]|uniref:DNA-3-methyladenine glycosylase family protein n=1 Tax=Brevibacillus borstelensis TaxID=45462 RepID=UPI001D0A0C4B|nr:DNA-3-methyladenine glycosylase [Brevibacillus borstelensis]MCC0566935.1 DNA-3-methyladenine glycosylase [Brevibacillus borstelensis]
MNWTCHGSSIELFPPREFHFGECLVFLGRSELEVLYQIKDGYLYKLVKVDQELVLLKIGCAGQTIRVDFPLGTPSEQVREKVAAYVWEWFDLEQNLSGFYEMARQDKVLHQLVQNYYGLRIIRIPDLFEALTWAIIGQQINLPFAYTLKKRFVEQFGEKLVYEGTVFWLYPAFDKIAAIDINELRSLQFTTRKAEYIIEVAKAMATGQVTKESLRHMNDRQHVQKTLLGIRGVGLWTADYVMMKCFADPAAFPVADVGLQNALKSRLGLQRKPTVDEIMDLGANWEGWQAYATFYLWRSLYEQAV